MFSSLSTMIWGEGQQTDSSPSQQPRPDSPVADDWELVGPASPAPGDLGALEPLRPSDSLPSSASASSAASEAGDVVPVVGPRALNRGRPCAPSLDAMAVAEARDTRSAQLLKQRHSGKSLSSKALKRSNKSVIVESCRKANARTNFSIKMAGNRNLKQC